MERSKMLLLAERLEDAAKNTGSKAARELAATVRTKIAERDLGHKLELRDNVTSTFDLEVAAKMAGEEKRQYRKSVLRFKKVKG